MNEEIKDFEVKESPVDANRGADDYVEAVEMIAELASVVVDVVPGLGNVKAVGKAAAIAPKAVKVLRKAAPVLNNEIVADAVVKAKENAPDAAKVVLGKAAGAKDSVLKPVRDKKAEMEAAKARKKARRSVIEAAEVLTIEEFKKRYATYKSLSEGGGMGYLEYSGCYVFILAKGLKRDLADYREVYVGSSLHNMGLAISEELEGKGNPDVYADAKYGQSLHILPYPCVEDKVAALKESLVVALDANVSYNSREQL